QPECFAITLGRGDDNFVRQTRARRIAVPASGLPFSVEPVPKRLLVETWLCLAGFVAIGGPEPGAVRRQHFIDQHDFASGVSEFELGISDDDTPLRRKVASTAVDQSRKPL